LQIKDSIGIEMPREIVFSALTDVEILEKCIPGCESLEALDEMKYSATILSKIGPLKLRFKGQAQLSDVTEPESYTIEGQGSGGPAGRAKVTARVTLKDVNNSTILTYDVNAEVGGKLAQLGGSLIKNTALKLATQFFEALNESLVNSNRKPPPLAVPDSSPTLSASRKILIAGTLVAGAIALIAAI
jgi:carbon monoxide dehydrogenase subunit G